MPSYSALWFIVNAVPVSNGRLFSDINVSQGNVAMWLSCGGMFAVKFIHSV